ncbi:MAG: hypothetical protein M3046_14175 [Actinomycetota bacterium]|nr:hypothetical protein [Actinomycetota bacterium]
MLDDCEYCRGEALGQGAVEKRDRVAEKFAEKTRGHFPRRLASLPTVPNSVQRTKVIRDFAYFVSQSLSAADRREYIDDLVETYLATLRSSGITYPEDQFWFDVRRTLLFCLAYPVQAMALDLTDQRAATLVREMAHRAASAITETGALDIVEHVRRVRLANGLQTNKTT